MLTIHEAHRYLDLMNNGLAKEIKCGNNEDHGSLVSWLDEDDTIFMCLACSYKIKPGYKMYRYIKSVLNNFKS